MTSVMYEIKKFDGKNDLKMWKAKVKEVLVTEGLAKALGGN
jgi:hypothetical protein